MQSIIVRALLGLGKPEMEGQALSADWICT